MELKKYKLGELLYKIENGAVVKQKKGATGIPITRIETLSKGVFNREKLGYADIEAPTLYANYILEDNDLLMSHINSKEFVGRTVIYKKQGNECIIHGMNLLRIKTNAKLLDPEFAYYYFQTDTIKRKLYNLRKDAIGQSSIAISDIKNMPVSVPDISVQRKIAFVLRSYDRKIELNRAINQNLEAMAKQLYDYWFVQFDFPNEEGKPYKSSGGEMVWNDILKRDIPRDWEVLPLFDAVSVQYGFPFATEQFTEEETNVPVVRIRDILEGTTSAYSLEKADEKYHLNENDVLVGMDGNFHMNFWHDNIAYLNQRCVRLRAHSDSTISSIQILHSIKPYIKAKEQNAKGSTVGHLSDKDLKGLYLTKPLKTKVFNPRKLFDALLAMTIGNKQQILSLTKQRNELLPLLMNGQVSVNSDLSYLHLRSQIFKFPQIQYYIY